MTTPDRSIEQRRAALLTANAIRTARKHLKRHLKRAGAADLARLIADPDTVARRLVPDAPAGYVDTLKLEHALVATRGIGAVKASRVLRVAGCSPSKTLGGLSRRQRDELVELIAPLRRLHACSPAPTGTTTTREDLAA